MSPGEGDLIAIIYAGGTNRNDSYVGLLTRRALIDSINTTLVAAGWASTATRAFVRLIFTGQPADTNTVTLDGKVYTFQTVLTNVNGNVLIGATALESYQNLKAAINLEAGAGTKYAAATTLHSTMQCPSTYFPNGSAANPTATTLKVEAKTAGSGGRGLAVSETCANMTIDEVGTATNHDGYLWDSATTTPGLKIRVFGFDAGEVANPPNNACARFIVGDQNSVVRSATGEPTSTDANAGPDKGFRLGLGNSAQWRVIANRYSFWVIVDGVSANYTTFAAGTGSLPTFLEPALITNATNATPIVITTSAAHGFTTGQQVCVRNVNGNTAANGTWVVTNLTATTFSLDTSVGNAAYTSGGVAALVSGGKVAEAIWSTDNTQTNVIGRVNIGSSGGVSHWTSINGQNYTKNGVAGAGTLGLNCIVPGDTDLGSNAFLFPDNSVVISEPFLSWGTGDAAAARLICQMFDAVVLRQSLTIDATGTFDSHNWRNLTNANTGSASVAQGSLLIVTP